ncbi:dehydratase [Amycolatopsis acidicola]|uniref:Dehydratase n=1 Tax=Amycolatopsis acidicola TaxID=2596893 RepID=A0A5N0VEQ1_9PSEU|nr:MaoC/PaaZ C-terminal domain-containing protein [Amycolatopsis acidicola]KAA9163311.1 dehydratase [Amycolatopsis acidicola]
MEKPQYYFEDFEVGDKFITPARTVTDYEIGQFAGLSGDFNPIHTDDTFAQESAFKQRIGHGLLTLSVTTGLANRLGIFEACTIALLGIEDWRFLGPVFSGDTVHAEVLIKEKRLTSDGRRGVLTREYTIVNQRGEAVQRGVLPLLAKCRPAA